MNIDLGPPDLTYFLEALDAVDVRNAFDPDMLVGIESAWKASNMHVNMFGWVVALKSGERLYLEMEITDTPGQSPTNLEITPLAAEQRYPDELEDAVAWYRPDHINRYLGLLHSN